MAFTEDTRRYREFKLGDLVYYHDTYVIPPDAVNWKFVETDHDDKLAIIVEENNAQWDMKPYGRHQLFKIMHVKSGRMRTCSSHNLTKAYFYDELE
tara:strand:+ start:244 stop:531 length:288 start_codon:yes stop_codon:yes gene_type:complete